MKNILVTGGCGFIASNFIKQLIDEDVFIVNLDKLTYAANKEYLSDIENRENYIFYHGDICCKQIVEEIFAKHNIDYVINFAAESHVDRSFEGGELFVKTNVLGVVNLLETARRFWKDFSKHKFLQISTDEVYGESEVECDENSLLKPTSPYSSSKASADLICLSYFKSFNFPVVITRSSNNFGYNQHPEKLIPKAVVTLAKNEKFFIHGGEQKRDWLFVLDNVRAIKLVLEKGKCGEVYNICAKNEICVNDIVDKIVKLVESKTKTNLASLIEVKNERVYNDFRYNISNKKIKSLGFEFSCNFEDEFDNTVNYYLDNLDYYYNKMKEGK